MSTEPKIHNIAVILFSSREAPDILELSIKHAIAEVSVLGGVVDVLINGKEQLAYETVSRYRAQKLPCDAMLRIWFLPLGDKAHAWNVYVHEIWSVARTTVFIDGYVRAGQKSIATADRELAENVDVLAATGVPSVGLSARKLRQQMLSEGGIHGNFYALNKETMNLIREKEFRLPLGLYRTDSLLGAVLCYRFDPQQHPWDPKLIKVLPEVTWSFNTLKWWRIGDLLTHFKRVMRQGQGVLENRAYRYYFRDRKIQPDKLPEIMIDLVEQWIKDDPQEAGKVLRRFSSAKRALARMRITRDWSLSKEKPSLLFDSTCVTS